MLLLDNMNPKLTVYYNASIILDVLQNKDNMDIVELYSDLKKTHNIDFNIYILCLDWLYLLNKINIDEKGVVELCL